jgi:catechol 2,3-dioxygenase-like lactoylglutathione lyase family enzyme
MVTGLAHVCFTVANLDKALAFYRDTIGFAVAFEFRRDNGERYGVYLKAGPRVFIELFQTDTVVPAPEKQSFKHICLEVDSIESTVSELKRKGVDVGEITLGMDQSYQAWLSDPDGNKIELHGYTSKSWQRPHLS